jgi:hypothetical protein
MFSDVESDEIGKLISIEEVEFIVNKIPKEKIPGPDGWNQELFRSFFVITGKDLLWAIEESKV